LALGLGRGAPPACAHSRVNQREQRQGRCVLVHARHSCGAQQVLQASLGNATQTVWPLPSGARGCPLGFALGPRREDVAWEYEGGRQRLARGVQLNDVFWGAWHRVAVDIIMMMTMVGGTQPLQKKERSAESRKEAQQRK